MPPVVVDPTRIHEFSDFQSFYDWLSVHHATEPEVWIRMHKVSSGLPSITPVSAIDAALCWGWIDAIRKGLNDTSYLQRYTPRGARSTWSQINRENVARLVDAGLMTAHGLRHVESAKADRRWDKAYRVKDARLPDDLLAAIDAEPEAKAMLATLTAQNRFALAFRLNALKTQAGREKRIAAFVDQLKRGETIYPQKAK
ncbi:MAG: YdeI/OmpD-associated family protein [Mesorhizobium sp.]